MMLKKGHMHGSPHLLSYKLGLGLVKETYKIAPRIEMFHTNEAAASHIETKTI